ncbi:hypothetical protein EDD70_1681 [Hydrogenoanaerobacterium saccharovorans]|uniref:Uncharacterized protein n=1 Tax=Hydrogenoanaerobacterium saccharovorans TaxID=474960 RepID=A0A1H7Z3N2_9FIRM|nr:hypothetical protein [Hydrogenoanaerobacterium saccharovorans]RPF48848.1 hypothetical protein EDD70_1681 [Hydrogenoanaerobacterium saccharovorans]SEM52833.1 hypothetical protein SAMN05216180_0415 [Hydrogenoanaerobacterium saccharovorans]
MKLMEHKPRPTTRKIAFFVFWSSLIIRTILLGLELFAGIYLIGTVTLQLLNFIILISALFLIKKRRVLLYFVTGLLIVCNAAFFLINNDSAEYYFTSPQKSNTLVIREKSALVSSGWADVYKLEFGIFKRKLNYRVGTNDSYQPFSHGQYRIEWSDESTVLLDYYSGKGYGQLKIEL